MPGEIYKINDRIRAILQIAEVEGRGPQLMLNRSCPEMVTELFSIEVPEINEDVIEIRGVARDAESERRRARTRNFVRNPENVRALLGDITYEPDQTTRRLVDPRQAQALRQCPATP